MVEAFVATSGSKKKLFPTLHSDYGKLLTLALWFGLITGLSEVALLVIAKVFLNRYIHFMDPYLVWATPLVNVGFFEFLAILLLLLSGFGLRRASLRVAIFCFSFLTALSVLLLYQRLHWYAALVLAAGVGMQGARLIAARANGFWCLVRLTTGWLIALVLILASLAYGWGWLEVRRTLASLPNGKSDRPNVLLVVLDTVRAANLSVYGYARPTTPRLEELAKTGVVFENAISPAPWTLPSHASMFTGRYPHELSVGFSSALDSTFPTLAEVLSEHGYLTAGFVANTWYCGRASGLNRGFTHYEDHVISPGQMIVSSSIGRTLSGSEWLRHTVGYYDELGRKTAPEINSSFLSWLAKRDTTRPFFAFLNYFDAHEPYLPPEAFGVRFGSTQPRPNPRHILDWRWTKPEIQAELNAYDGAINYLDHYIGALLDEVGEMGILQNTIVIITADHGEEFCEHGILDHGYSLYLPLLHVPLLISSPGTIPSGLRVQAHVSLRNLSATVLDLLNLKDGTSLPGRSLALCWTGPHQDASLTDPLLSELEATPDLPDWYPAAKGEMKSLITSQYQYIRDGNNDEELYDIVNDPLERQNLASDRQAIVDEFREAASPFLSSEAAAGK